MDFSWRIVSGKCSEIKAAHRFEQPSRLPFFLHGPAGGQGCDAPFHRALVDLNLFQPAEVQRYPGVSGGFFRRMDSFRFGDRSRAHRGSSTFASSFVFEKIARSFFVSDK